MFQRVALSTAANMCKKLPSDAADFVMEAVPLLTNLLQYHDAKVRLYFVIKLVISLESRDHIINCISSPYALFL